MIGGYEGARAGATLMLEVEGGEAELGAIGGRRRRIVGVKELARSMQR